MKIVRWLGVATIAVTTLAGASSAVAAEDGNPTTSAIAAEAQPDGSQVFEADGIGIVVQPAATLRVSDPDLSAMAATFTCNLDVQWPHGSTHVSGTINVVTRIDCQIPAAHLRLATSLIRTSPTYAQWHAGTKNQDNTAWLQNNRAVPCNQGPGNFRGWGWGTITAPPGYQLSGPADYDKYGDIKPVACGVSRVSGGDDTEYAERITVSFVRSDLVG